MRIKRRRKDGFRPSKLVFRRGEGSDIRAKGRKGGKQQGKESWVRPFDHRQELEQWVKREQERMRVIGILHRKRLNGTLECIHDVSHKYTSMRTHEDIPAIPKGKWVCQCCNLAFWEKGEE